MSSTQSVDLYDFLNDIGLISYLQPMRVQLGVETFEQLKYVKKDDLQGFEYNTYMGDMVDASFQQNFV